MNDDVDKAYELLESQPRSITNLEAALRILLKREVESKDLQSSLRRLIYWGLMAVEKEMGCYKGLETAEMMEHVNKAQGYCIEVEKILLQSSDASFDAQVSLERYIIKGRKAVLDSRVTEDVDKLKRSKSEAKSGIDASLGKLQEVDPKSYDEFFKTAMWWRENFSS